MTNSLTVKEFQNILLGMMSEFHDFCEKNGLTYYMVGGTLLGAVREGGFIPWDDDVDFAMPRADYERFIRIYSGNLDLHCLKNDKKHMFPYVKLFHKETPLVRIDDETHGFHSDVFTKFDIYPIDGLGKTEAKAHKHLQKVSKKKHLLYINLTKGKSPSAIKRCICGVIRLLPSRQILRSIEGSMKKYPLEKSSYITRWREGGVTPNVIAKEIFGEPLLLPFEQYHFYAPRDYHAYLTSVYGDYTVRKQGGANLRHDAAKNDVAKKLADSLKK